jgi:carbonic anhydrase
MAVNVKRTVKAIMERSTILKEMVEAGQIGIVGGTHDITTGEVTFYQDTLIINNLKSLASCYISNRFN